MRKFLPILFLFSLFTFTISPVLASTDGSQIKYFGYYYGFPGIAKTGSYVNALFIERGVSVEDVINDLIEFKKYNVKGIIDVAYVFYTIDQTTGKHVLRPDYLSRWDSYWAKLSTYKDSILAFYPLDEPDINTTRIPFWTQVAAIKSLAPDIPIIELLTRYGASDLCQKGEPNVGIPPQIDWLSFDWYFCWNAPANHPDCQPPVSELISCFNQKAATTTSLDGQPRKVILIPDAYLPNREIYEDQMAFINYQYSLIPANDWYYQQCKQSSQCFGLFPFVWKTFLTGGEFLVGVESMPILEDHLKNNIAPKIVNKSQLIDILFHRFFLSRFSDIFNYNLLIANYGNYSSIPINMSLLFPKTGLVSYYKMDESEGDLMADSAGGSNFTSYGAAIMGGKFGNGRSFNRSEGDYAEAAGSNAFDFEKNQPFSIAAWVYPTNPTFQVSYSTIFSKSLSGAGGYGFRFDSPTLGTGQLTAFLAGSSCNTACLYKRANAGVPPNAWYHVVVTYNGSSQASGMKLYLNGNEQATTTYFDNINVATTIRNNVSARIGASQVTAENFHSTIDELGIWNRALTSDEVKDLYNNGQGQSLQ